MNFTICDFLSPDKKSNYVKNIIGETYFRRFLLSIHSCQTTRSCEALKIEEYVPLAIPINIATTNHLIDSPPNTRRVNKTSIAVSDVFNDLTKVWRIESLTTCGKVAVIFLLRFSRILSKTTIVS